MERLKDLWSNITQFTSDAWASYREWPRGRQIAVASGVAVVLLLGIVGVTLALTGGGDEPVAVETTTTSTTSTSTTTSSTTSSTTSTTMARTGPTSPLNGLQADDPALLDRRVLAVKIDNHPNARPQSGINDADLVYELLVEGGLSRFIALFHDNDVDYIGPIRSGRVTDPELIRPMEPVLVFSGAQPWIQAIISAADIPIIGEVEGTFRVDSRFAPHNLYGDTLALRDTAEARGYEDTPPGPFFTIGDNEGGEPAVEISMTWDAGNRALWRFEEGRYIRFTNELPHLIVSQDGTEEPLSTEVLVVLQGERYTASPPDASGSAVPAMRTTGSGTAYVFANGVVHEGTWSRDSIEDPFELSTADGAELLVPAGRPWVAFFPNDQPITWLAEIPTP